MGLLVVEEVRLSGDRLLGLGLEVGLELVGELGLCVLELGLRLGLRGSLRLGSARGPDRERWEKGGLRFLAFEPSRPR